MPMNNIYIAENKDLLHIARCITDMADMPFKGLDYLTKHYARYPGTIHYCDWQGAVRGFTTHYINRNQFSTFLVLESIYVEPESRNMRIGTAMLSHIENVMINEGIDTIYIAELADYATVHGYFKWADMHVIYKQKQEKAPVLRLVA